MLLKSLRTRKGFTLVEVIVSIAILSIIILSIYSFFSYSQKVFKNGVDQYDVQSNIRFALDYITKEIRYATKIQILNSMDPDKIADPLNKIDAYENYIYYNNGKIIRLSKYSSNSYFIGVGGTLEFSSTAPGKILDFTLKGVDANQTYSVDSEVKPLNLSVEGASINTLTGPVIFYRTIDDYISKMALPEATLGNNTNPKELDINYSKGILSVSVISDSGAASGPAATLAKVDIRKLHLTVANPGAASGRAIVFVVELDDHGLYEYKLTYTTQWNIE